MRARRFAQLRLVSLLVVILVLSLPNSPVEAQESTAGTANSYSYLSPAPQSTNESAGTTVVLRNGEPIEVKSVQASLFHVTGSRSGLHSGRALLARDGLTIIFQPDSSFLPGETVTVLVDEGVRLQSGRSLPPVQWQFRVSDSLYPYTPDPTLNFESQDATVSAPNAGSRQVTAAGGDVQTFVQPHYVTAPDLMPKTIITRTGAALSQGLLFFAPAWYPEPSRGATTLILDDQANVVYYHHSSYILSDFKRQPNGHLTYYDNSTVSFKELDNTYAVVNTWTAGNGYVTDVHDLQLLPNGHALLLIYAPQQMDLSTYGGLSNATVIDVVVQELDQDKNVVFQWKGLDHYAITDTYEPLTAARVDHCHANAIELDSDGNLLLSCRHLSEITKIDRNTGAIIWRLNGKNNQFTFVGDAELAGVGAFSYQHDIRRLANGHITLFDNGNQFIAANLRGSRGVEYALDETTKTATLVKQLRLSPDVLSTFMGNVQQQANGNTVVGWGGGVFVPASVLPAEALTEFTPDGQVAMNVNFIGDPYVSYRAFRFPWQGYPTEPPKLVAITTTTPISLYYSWNGATEVVSYTVAGGASPANLTPFATQAKTGFEESTALDAAANGDCFFQVTPHQKDGRPSPASNLVYVGDQACSSAVTAQPGAPSNLSVPMPVAGGVSTVTVSIEAGTGTSPTIITVAPNTGMTQPPPEGLALTGLAFDLSALDAGTLGSLSSSSSGQATPFAKPVQVRIAYSAAHLPHIAGLTLARWDPAAQSWTNAGVALTSNDTYNRQLTAQVDQPGTYALLTANQAPTSGDARVYTLENKPYTFRHYNFPYWDADGDPLHSVVVVSLPVSGTLSLGGAAVSAGQVIPVGQITKLVYTPPGHQYGRPYATFTFAVSDGYARSQPYAAEIYVRSGSNRPPTAVMDLAVAPVPVPPAPDTALTPIVIDVLANDTDPDGDPLSVIAVAQPQHGTAAVAEDKVVYTPRSDYAGFDQFTYIIADGQGAQTTATVFVTGAINRLFMPLIAAGAK